MKIQSRKFLPLMYQLAARLGTKSHHNRLFQGTLNEVWLAFIHRSKFGERLWFVRKLLTFIFNCTVGENNCQRAYYVSLLIPTFCWRKLLSVRSTAVLFLLRSFPFLLLAYEELQLKSELFTIWPKNAINFAISQGFTSHHTTSHYTASQCTMLHYTILRYAARHGTTCALQ